MIEPLQVFVGEQLSGKEARTAKTLQSSADRACDWATVSQGGWGELITAIDC
jgi:hypothetical protein